MKGAGKTAELLPWVTRNVAVSFENGNDGIASAAARKVGAEICRHFVELALGLSDVTLDTAEGCDGGVNWWLWGRFDVLCVIAAHEHWLRICALIERKCRAEETESADILRATARLRGSLLPPGLLVLVELHDDADPGAATVLTPYSSFDWGEAEVVSRDKLGAFVAARYEARFASFFEERFVGIARRAADDPARRRSPVRLNEVFGTSTKELAKQLSATEGAETAGGPAVYYSTFISYGTPDEVFAVRLDRALLQRGVVTFFFPRDAPPGRKLHHVMREEVNRNDKVILICSKASLGRPGVLNEIGEVLQREARDGGVEYLVPVTLDDYVFREWRPKEPGIAQAIRDRVVADFRETDADPAKFEERVARLVCALVKSATR